MEICYLPIEKLRKDPDNFFAPLPPVEYGDLRKSIQRHGMQEPLIVTSEANGLYTILSGHNRFVVAGETGIKTLPCIIIDRTLIEGAIDTEIFRRHLSPEERVKFKALKEERCKGIIRNMLKENLLPELYEKYEHGVLTQETALDLLKFKIEDQAALLHCEEEEEVDRVLDSKENIDLKNAIEEKEKQLEEQKNLLAKKEKELEELKKWKKEKEEMLEDKIAEFDEKKDRAEELAQEGVQKELMDLANVNSTLRENVKKMHGEIEDLKEKLKKKKKEMDPEEIEEKAKEILELEDQRKYMVNIIVHLLDRAMEEIKKAKNKVDGPLCKRDFKLVRGKLEEIIKSSKELLMNIKENKKEDRVYM